MTDSLPRSCARLTEEERHGLADGTLPADQRTDAESHLAACAECAGDVTRLHSLMSRLDHLSDAPGAELDALWPAIRTRIERRKVVPLGSATSARLARHHAPWAWLTVGIAAAVILAFALGRVSQPRHSQMESVATITPGIPPSVNVADSSRQYQQEVESLLEELELRRSMLQPATAANVDRDLRIIDGAIGELTDALARDPDNPALRQLLAASYRQKRDLLKQVDNAS